MRYEISPMIWFDGELYHCTVPVPNRPRKWVNCTVDLRDGLPIAQPDPMWLHTEHERKSVCSSAILQVRGIL